MRKYTVSSDNHMEAALAAMKDPDRRIKISSDDDNPLYSMDPKIREQAWIDNHEAYKAAVEERKRKRREYLDSLSPAEIAKMIRDR